MLQEDCCFKGIEDNSHDGYIFITCKEEVDLDPSLQALERLLYHRPENLYSPLQKNWIKIVGLGCSRAIRSSNEKTVSQASFEEQYCKNSSQIN